MSGFLEKIDYCRLLRFGCVVLLLCSLSLYASKDEQSIYIEYEEESKDVEVSEEDGFLGVERIFKNPILASGLSSGTHSINRSIDTLMESVFYSLLDNEFIYSVNDLSQFLAELKRNLYTTSEGNFVVVDRFSMGPDYLRSFMTVSDIPVNIGANARGSVLNVYTRTDGQRLVEDQELPFYRVVINNWFGLIPVLSFLLPPSFNPNHLYDPVKQLKTPFVFPLTIDTFRSMEVGAISSYSISGGVHLGFDVAEKYTKDINKRLTDLKKIESTLPYSVFLSGDQRINVLRKGENIAWVGLSSQDKLGHGIRADFGNVYFIFDKLLPYWKGVPVAIFPIDIKRDIAKVFYYDHLYSFDLSTKLGREAYLKAVRGDFVFAYEKSIEGKNKGIDNGVRFHFKRKRKGIESEFIRSSQLFVRSIGRGDLQTKLEIETFDGDGKYYILETKRQIEVEDWDVLVGVEQLNFNNKVEIQVEKNKGDKLPEYFIRSDIDNPISLILSFNIVDRYIDTKDYKTYVSLLRKFTQLPLEGVPSIPLRKEVGLQQRRLDKTLTNPLRNITDLHVTPTILGRMTADAAIFFSNKSINNILNHSDDDIWKAFALSYGVPVDQWKDERARSIWNNSVRWMSKYLFYPLKLLNWNISYSDAVSEVTNFIKAVRKLKKARTVMEKLEAFDLLVDTAHPVFFAGALLNLSDLDKIPRSVSFTTKPNKVKDPEIVEQLKSINRKFFRSRAVYPSGLNRRIKQEELTAFNPRQLKERRERPRIKRVYLTNEGKDGQKDLYIKMIAVNIKSKEDVKVYLKVEQGGKVNVGRFVLFERIVAIPPWAFLSNPGRKLKKGWLIGMFLTGDASLFKDFLFENALYLGGEFLVSLAVSGDGGIWSREKKFSFRYEEGRLLTADGNKAK